MIDWGEKFKTTRHIKFVKESVPKKELVQTMKMRPLPCAFCGELLKPIERIRNIFACAKCTEGGTLHARLDLTGRNVRAKIIGASRTADPLLQ